MSSKNTIFLTEDNEHCYHDCNDDTIVIELSKKNIEILLDDEDDFIIQVNSGSDLYNIFNKIKL